MPAMDGGLPSNRGVDLLLQDGLGDRTDDLLDDNTVLEDEQGGDASDAVGCWG